jgi:hypothetical protein
MTGVEHPHLMAVLSQDWRQGLNAQGREPHHLNSSITRFRAAEFFRQQPVEIFVSHVNQEYSRSSYLSSFGVYSLKHLVRRRGSPEKVCAGTFAPARSADYQALISTRCDNMHIIAARRFQIRHLAVVK